MSISRTIVFEAATGAALATAGVAIASPGDLWLARAAAHPGWLVVLVLAARYGTLGMLLALGLTAGALALASLALDASLAGLAIRTSSAADLWWLIAAIAVAWIAMLHESRRSRLSRRLDDAEASQRTTAETMTALHDAIALLRARHDRIDLSLTRLGSRDPATAARAALELGAIRCGAAGGTVCSWDGDSLGVIARYGREPDRVERGACDRTARAAIEQRRPVTAAAVGGATDRDSDVAVPIVDDGGALRAVLALRGVTPDNLCAAGLQDLRVVAQWLAPALGGGMAPRRRLAKGTQW
jgi:hypothetical protein